MLAALKTVFPSTVDRHLGASNGGLLREALEARKPASIDLTIDRRADYSRTIGGPHSVGMIDELPMVESIAASESRLFGYLMLETEHSLPFEQEQWVLLPPRLLPSLYLASNQKKG